MDVQEKIDKGYIHTRIITEVLGKPEGHVRESLVTYVKKIKKINGLEVLKENIAKPKKKKDELWSAFAELEILFKNTAILTNFCFLFMPSSIEIIAPEKISFRNNELAAVLNDLQAKLHTLHATTRKLQNENALCKKNIQTIVSNFISILLLKSGKTQQQLSKLTGLSENNIIIALRNMMKKGIVKKEGDNYLFVQK